MYRERKSACSIRIQEAVYLSLIVLYIFGSQIAVKSVYAGVINKINMVCCMLASCGIFFCIGQEIERVWSVAGEKASVCKKSENYALCFFLIYLILGTFSEIFFQGKRIVPALTDTAVLRNERNFAVPLFFIGCSLTVFVLLKKVWKKWLDSSWSYLTAVILSAAGLFLMRMDQNRLPGELVLVGGRNSILCLMIFFIYVVFGWKLSRNKKTEIKTAVTSLLVSAAAAVLYLAGFQNFGTLFLPWAAVLGFFSVSKWLENIFGTEKQANQGSRIIKKEKSRLCIRREESGSVGRYLLFYTVCFVGVSLLFFSACYAANKGLIWANDGKPQYFTFLRYLGRYLRELFENIRNGIFGLKMYDFSIGMGQDVGTVVKFRPDEFLSVFVPEQYTEILYYVLTILRMYLTGLSFSAFCFYKTLPRWNTLIGSVMYAFCGYVVIKGIQHPMFIMPVLLFPLLLIGLDRLIREKKRAFFVLMVALSLAVSYYFTYMMTIAMGVYALLVFAEHFRKNRIREFLRMLGRIAVNYLLGACIAAVFFFPTISSLFSSDRLGFDHVFTVNLWSYGADRLQRLFDDFIVSGYTAGYTTYMNFAVLALPAMVILFLRKWKEYWGIKVALILEIALLMLPAGGYLMSAFSTMDNRWIFIMAFTVCYGTALVMDDFSSMSAIQTIGILAALLLYGRDYQRSGDSLMGVSFALLLICMAALLILRFWKNTSHNQAGAVLLTIVLISVTANGWYAFSPEGMGFSDEFMNLGEISQEVEETYFNRLAGIEDDSFYRVDTQLVKRKNENWGTALGYNGISVFNSVIPSALVKYHMDMESIGLTGTNWINYLDGRSGMEALAGVKYYMTAAGKAQYVPYGFSKVEDLSDDEYEIYRNENALPLGYTYDTWMDTETYEKLTPLERQAAMMKAVVLQDQTDAGTVNKGYPEENINVVVPELLKMDSAITRDGTSYLVGEEKAGIKLSYEKKAGYEAYLHVTGLDGDYQKTEIKVKTSQLSKSIFFRGKESIYSTGMSDYLVNLGYSDQDESDYVKLIFTDVGEYQLEGYEILYLPMEEYDRDVRKLSQEVLENIDVKDNVICGDAIVSEDKIMVFSIPYSSGWSAYVDGEKTEVFQANVLYTGIYLPDGDHKIELRYVTPGLKAGSVLSIIGCLIFAASLIFERKRKIMG